jgi:hypothetical protein
MAVPISNVVRRVVFAPSGTGPYAFTFEILAATDIEVYKGDTLLTLTTDYTVTINPNGTGEVTLVATAGTDNITIVGARTIQRTTDFVTGGDLFANSLNEELDSLTIFTQQNAEAVARSLTAPVTDPTTIDMTLPRAADRAGKFLSFDSNGNPVPGAIPPEVQQVLAIEDELIAVAAIDSEIVAVDANEANIITVAGITSDLATVAGVAANVTTVAGIAADVTSVAGDATDIGAVAAISSDVTTVAGIAADVTAVAGVDAGDLAAVAAIDSDVTTVAGIAANVTTVAGISADVTTVAADGTDIGTVASNIANVNTVAGISSNVTTVAGISADVTAVAGDATDIGTVAGIAANVTTVAGIAANVTTVAGISSDVTTVATNVADITNFSDVYLGPAATDPATRNDSSALQEGDLYFNTVDDAIKVYTGSAWVTAYITADGFVTVADAQTITGVKTFDNGLATDTISEKTSATGVTIDGVLLKDSQVTTDQINEKTSAAGVTIDGVLLKDNGVVTGAGTVSAPVYSTTGDTNTGIFFPAADTIAFAEGGAEAMRIDSDGNVGIGSTSPSTFNDAATGGRNVVIQSTGSGRGVLVFASEQTSGADEPLGVINFIDSGSTNTAYRGASITGLRGSDDNSAYLRFNTANSGNGAERARITSGGFFKASNNGTYTAVGVGYHEFYNSNNVAVLWLNNANASFADRALGITALRSANSVYHFGEWYSGEFADKEFGFRGDGNAYADGTWNNNGADYAEYFESTNGQALTLGAAVVLDGNKVREATEQDPASAVIGVVRPKEPSKASMVVGNTAWNKWANKYLTDDFDRYIMEDHDVVEWEETITDEDGNTSTKQHSYESHNIPEGITVPEDATRKTHDEKGNKFQHYKLNPAWNPDSEYVNRENRPEWNIIGLLGQVKILKGQPVGDRWVKMRDVSDTVEEWFIR